MRYDDVVMFSILFVAPASCCCCSLHQSDFNPKKGKRANGNKMQRAQSLDSHFIAYISFDRSTCKSLRKHYTHTLIVSNIFFAYFILQFLAYFSSCDFFSMCTRTFLWSLCVLICYETDAKKSHH